MKCAFCKTSGHTISACRHPDVERIVTGIRKKMDYIVHDIEYVSPIKVELCLLQYPLIHLKLYAASLGQKTSGTKKQLVESMAPLIVIDNKPYSKIYYTLREWASRVAVLDSSKWVYLAANPSAIDILEANREIENHNIWRGLSANGNANLLIKKYIDKTIEWGLAENPNAVELLDEYPLKIDWNKIWDHPNVMHFVELYPEKINWLILCNNPAAIPYIEKHLDKVFWSSLSENPNAIHILEQNLDKIDWYKLSGNPNAIHLLERFPDNIKWNRLSANPNAIHLLESHIEYVDWTYLSMNPNPKAIPLLLQRPNSINWRFMGINPIAGEILAKNSDEVNADIFTRSPILFENPCIFETKQVYYYHTIKKTFLDGIGRELTEWIWHPRNMPRWGPSHWHLVDEDDTEE